MPIPTKRKPPYGAIQERMLGPAHPAPMPGISQQHFDIKHGPGSRLLPPGAQPPFNPQNLRPAAPMTAEDAVRYNPSGGASRDRMFGPAADVNASPLTTASAAVTGAERFQGPGRQGPVPLTQQMHHQDKAEAVGAYDVGTSGLHGDSRLSGMIANEESAAEIFGGISENAHTGMMETRPRNYIQPDPMLDIRSPGGGFPAGDAAYRHGVVSEFGDIVGDRLDQMDPNLQAPPEMQYGRNFSVPGEFDVNLPHENQRVTDEQLAGPEPTRDPNKMGPLDRAMSWMWPSVKRDWRADQRLKMQQDYYKTRGTAAQTAAQKAGSEWHQVAGGMYNSETDQFRMAPKGVMKIGNDGIYDRDTKQWVREPSAKVPASVMSFLTKGGVNIFDPSDGPIYGMMEKALAATDAKEKRKYQMEMARLLRPHIKTVMENMANEAYGIESIDMTGDMMSYIMQEALILAGGELEGAEALVGTEAGGSMSDKFKEAQKGNPGLKENEFFDQLIQEEIGAEQ